MLDRRIALDARDDLGPALLLHLVSARTRGACQIGPVRTRPWSAQESWRLGVAGGSHLNVQRVDSSEALVVGGVPCESSADLGLAGEDRGSEELVVFASVDGHAPTHDALPELTSAGVGVADGHALALASALRLVSSRLELRWALAELEVAPRSEPHSSKSAQRAALKAVPSLAGKLSMRIRQGARELDRLIVCTSLGGAPGHAGVMEGLGDALASPRHASRLLEAPGAVPRSALLGSGRLAWMVSETHALGPMARFVFDYDARDLRAARMVELAIAYLDAREVEA